MVQIDTGPKVNRFDARSLLVYLVLAGWPLIGIEALQDHDRDLRRGLLRYSLNAGIVFAWF
jgi:hypothetical protein